MYCEKCGTLKQNGVCPKCNNNGDSNWVIFTVLKCIFIPLGISALLFFITTFISVMLNIVLYSNGTVEPSFVLKIILPFFQLILPILIIMFGWVVILLIDLKKHRNK